MYNCVKIYSFRSLFCRNTVNSKIHWSFMPTFRETPCASINLAPRQRGSFFTCFRPMMDSLGWHEITRQTQVAVPHSRHQLCSSASRIYAMDWAMDRLALSMKSEAAPLINKNTLRSGNAKRCKLQTKALSL